MLEDRNSLAIAGGATCLAVTISISSICLHLRNYTEPVFQRYIIRILFMVPFYCICSYGSLTYREYNLWFDTPRDCYEAWVIYNFTALCLAYLGGPGAVVIKAEGHILYSSWKHTTCCLPRTMIIDGFFLRRVKQATLQFVVLKPILALLVLVLFAFGKYEEGNWSFSDGYMYICVIYNVCYTIALYGLLVFYLGTEELLHEFNPLLKLILVKGVIFLTFWQGIVISMFSAQVRLITPEDQGALQDFIVVMEMLLAAFLMLFAFPHTEFKAGGSTSGWSMGAITHAISIKDVVMDTLHQFNPSYQAYVLYSDGNPSDNVKKKSMRPKKKDDDFEEFAVSRTTKDAAFPKSQFPSFRKRDVEHGPDTLDEDPEGQEWISSEADGNKLLSRIMKPKNWVPAIMENERKQAELLDSDSDADFDEDQEEEMDNQFAAIQQQSGSNLAKDEGNGRHLVRPPPGGFGSRVMAPIASMINLEPEEEDDRPL